MILDVVDMGCSHSFIFAILVAVAFCYILLRKYKKRRGSVTTRLPPGKMGWPYIGETLNLYSHDPNVFFSSKQKRYGEIFKTHVLGCPCVMLASPEAARFVLVTRAELFRPTYPRSKETMIGPSALFFHQGKYHGRLRRLVQSSLSPQTIRRLVPDIESTVVSTLDSWNGQTLSTFQLMKKLSFAVGILTIFGGRLRDRHREELKENYYILDKGYNSFPTSIPGTPYSKAIKARRQLSRILSEIMNERRKDGVVAHDMLGCLMEPSENLSDDQISDNIIGVLFAAQDTTASVMTWIVKYLHDNPKIFEAVKAEQMVIYEENERGTRPLTWAQTRRMASTHKFVMESLRMASIISFTFREAVEDVEYKGYHIPKGWKVMPLFRNIHHSPELFKDPHKFDPPRFNTVKPNTFMPFGNGIHACPGNELAKLEMFILVHHLVTKYRLEVVGSQREVEYSPFPVPKHGLRARLVKEGVLSGDIIQRHELT